jgi:cytoskeletal protein RodZ
MTSPDPHPPRARDRGLERMRSLRRWAVALTAAGALALSGLAWASTNHTKTTASSPTSSPAATSSTDTGSSSSSTDSGSTSSSDTGSSSTDTGSATGSSSSAPSSTDQTPTVTSGGS